MTIRRPNLCVWIGCVTACASLALQSACATSPVSAGGSGAAAEGVALDAATLAQRRIEVLATERAFAATMARRDFAAFRAFLAADTVFFSGPAPLHGPDAVATVWKRFYEQPAAPFSWEPREVEVLSSGTLALSTGPVRDPAGKLTAEFTSIWRREPDGRWRIVFDKGTDACECAAPPAAR